MLCEQVMKGDPKCLDEWNTVQTAAKLMRDENIGFVPIRDADGKIIGTVTDRDIVVRITADNSRVDKPLSSLMSRDVVSCKATDELSRAEELMETNRKSRIVCVDDHGRAVGIISLADIAQQADCGRAGLLLRTITKREVREQ